jgi:hypothetical protein
MLARDAEGLRARKTMATDKHRCTQIMARRGKRRQYGGSGARREATFEVFSGGFQAALPAARGISIRLCFFLYTWSALFA